MALVLDPDMALGTARALARLQGREDVPETEEQPGRILHEIRSSSGASLALADGHIYYGSIDATPLFVMLVRELWRWGAPRRGAAEELLPGMSTPRSRGRSAGWRRGRRVPRATGPPCRARS